MYLKERKKDKSTTNKTLIMKVKQWVTGNHEKKKSLLKKTKKKNNREKFNNAVVGISVNNKANL